MAKEDNNKGEPRPAWWPWAVVGVAVVGLYLAARDCGGDPDSDAGVPTTVAPSASPAGSVPPTGPQGRAIKTVVADQEASSPGYRMKFNLGTPAAALPTASAGGVSTASSDSPTASSSADR